MVVKARFSIVAARIEAQASPLSHLLRLAARRPSREPVPPVYPRLATDTATPAGSLPRELCPSQYEWDERWDCLS
jgi:hypothetical protein